MAEQSATTSKDEQKLSIPVSTIFNPIYTHDLYKLPAEPIKYWLEQGIHIRRCIGEGAFAAAYEGYYEKNAKLPAGKEKFCGKDFAVKVHHVGYHPYVPGMPNKDKIDEETMNEMAFANRTDLVHPNIIEFHFTAQYPLNPQTVCDHVFIFMERAMFPLQELLNVLMKMKAQVPSSVGIHWIRSMASGIQHLHSIGLAHNDLHSYNIFVFGDAQPDGNCFKLKNIQVKLADFGKCTDISKESEAGKATKIQKDIERLCLMFISICDRISFTEEVRKHCVDLFNQCYQQKISFSDLLKSKPLSPPKEADDWTIFVAAV